MKLLAALSLLLLVAFLATRRPKNRGKVLILPYSPDWEPIPLGRWVEPDDGWGIGV